MQQVTNPYAEDFSPVSPLLGFVVGQGMPETPPIPYSPEGWKNSKIAAGTGETPAATPAPTPAETKKAGPMLTAEQSRVIQGLVGGFQPQHYPGVVNPGSIKPHVPQMAQLALPQATGPKRQSLGNLIYGKG